MEHREPRPHVGNRKCGNSIGYYIFSKGGRYVEFNLQQSLDFILRVNWAMSEFSRMRIVFELPSHTSYVAKRKSPKLQFFNI